MIDINKKYQTRNSKEVRIYATDGGGSYPIHGAIKCGLEWHSTLWSQNGEFHYDSADGLDLIEIVPKTDISISLDKKYKTRGGREVRLYSVNAGGKFPIHGAFFCENTHAWLQQNWTKEGMALNTKMGIEHMFDLIEVFKEIKIDLWLNISKEGYVAPFYNKELAYSCSNIYTVAGEKEVVSRIHIPIIVKEGQME